MEKQNPILEDNLKALVGLEKTATGEAQPA